MTPPTGAAAWSTLPAPSCSVPPDHGPVVAALRDQPGPDRHAAETAAIRLAALATPPGALGAVGDLAVRLAAATGVCPPPVARRPALLVATGDHGVHARGVTPWPQQLSSVLAHTIAAGGAGGAVLADEVGARVVVLDVGLASTPRPHPRLVSIPVVAGTRDLTTEDALTTDELHAAVATGAAVTTALLDEGADLLVLGDAGIGNTTPSAVLVSLATDTPAERTTGRGSGIDDPTLAHKVEVVATATRRIRAAAGDEPLHWLAASGGAEHAALVGALMTATSRRVPVVLDGVITCAAALVAAAYAPACLAGLVAGHRSAEPGAEVALQHLGLEPVLDAGLRLGEGSGGLLAVPTVRAAARLLTDVVTLAELRADG
jgi:nicotinate-nucleotide--dimethylbenzimidazole phosphoribosyltransferase